MVTVMARMSWPLILAIVGVVVACTSPPTDDDDPRGCEVTFVDPDFQRFGFTFDVSTPSQCPIQLDTPGQRLPFSGELAYQGFVSTPGPSDIGGFIQVENPQGTGVGGTNLNFMFNQPLGADLFEDPGIWEANFSTDYSAGTLGGEQSDTGLLFYEVDFDEDGDGFFGGPGERVLITATVDLPYTEVPGATMSGPSTASSNNIVEISADVANRKLPITYTWYFDGNIVATRVRNSYHDSYTTFGLEPGSRVFDVVVTDAEGDTGGESHTVSVTTSEGDP